MLQLFSKKFFWVLLLLVGATAAWLIWITVYQPVGQTIQALPTIPEEDFPDPQRTYNGPFKNIDPAVAYVGADQCTSCHGSIARKFSQHPMGRSILPIKKIASKQQYGEKQNNPFTAFNSLFLVQVDGNRVKHHRQKTDRTGKEIYDLILDAEFVLGSGARGHSYLCNRDGYVLQTMISWYSQKKIWDISPGFSEPLLSGRAVLPRCLFCHADRVEPVEGAINHYSEPLFPHGAAIGCERCHGPGELHVKSHNRFDPAAEMIDHTIINPRHLPWELREAVCQQCHLDGDAIALRPGRTEFDFRPGLPLDAVESVFVLQSTEGRSSRKAVNHVVQMYESVCFQKTSDADKLGCISCHDPHRAVAPQERIPYFRDRCLQCHENGHAGCAVPLEQRLHKEQNSCIACHMPRYTASDIPHTAATDHRILRFAKPDATSREAAPSGSVLMPFGRKFDPKDLAIRRDMGVALVNMAARGEKLHPSQMNLALQMLDNALKKWPGDLDAWKAKARIEYLLERQEESLRTYQMVLQRLPKDEAVLRDAATVAQQLGKNDLALQYWQRAIELNPWEPSYRHPLVELLTQNEAWTEVEEQTTAWLKLNPASVDARIHLTNCLLHTGRRAQAEEVYAEIRGLQPPNLRDIAVWYLNEKRKVSR